MLAINPRCSPSFLKTTRQERPKRLHLSKKRIELILQRNRTTTTTRPLNATSIKLRKSKTSKITGAPSDTSKSAQSQAIPKATEAKATIHSGKPSLPRASPAVIDMRVQTTPDFFPFPPTSPSSLKRGIEELEDPEESSPRKEMRSLSPLPEDRNDAEDLAHQFQMASAAAPASIGISPKRSIEETEDAEEVEAKRFEQQASIPAPATREESASTIINDNTEVFTSEITRESTWTEPESDTSAELIRSPCDSCDLNFEDSETNITADHLSKQDALRQGDGTKAKEKPQLSQSIKSNLQQFVGKPARGIINKDVLCYRISMIQILMHNVNFIAWIQQEHSVDKCASGRGNNCLTCVLSLMTQAYWNRGPLKKLYTLDQLMSELNVLCHNLGWYSGGYNGHGDPEDQWRWILNRIEPEVGEKAYKALLSSGKLVLESSMKCDLCGESTVKREEQDGLLSICLEPAPPKLNGEYHLHQFIIRHFKGDEIEGHKCEKCDEISTKRREFKIVHAPDTLTIQLGRFDPWGNKIDAEIRYREGLNLSGFLKNKDSQPRAAYKLSAVITHQGDSTEMGHYRAYVKNPASGTWTWCDDESTSLCIGPRLMAPMQPARHHRGQTTYVLYYSRE